MQPRREYRTFYSVIGGVDVLMKIDAVSVCTSLLIFGLVH